MELSVTELKQKVEELKQEIPLYARNAQAEINSIQQALQNKIRESQKHIDNLEGKLEGYVELSKFLQGPEAPDGGPEPGKPETPPVTDGSEQEGPKDEKPIPLPIA